MKNVIVSHYNAQWPEVFESLRAKIWPSIADIAESVEHIGSTAVPGLSAKPVIDLTIVVADQDTLNIVIRRLASLGVSHRGDLGIEGREVFTRLEGYPLHHLYASVSGSLPLRNHLAVRDALRSSEELRNQYGALKRQLAKQYPHDIDAYMAGKSGFIQTILNNSGFSSAEMAEIQRVNSDLTN